MVAVTSTVNWRIVNVETASLMAIKTLYIGEAESHKSHAADISKLQNDVLKQAEASLASFIGSVNYSDTFHVAAAAQVWLCKHELGPCQGLILRCSAYGGMYSLLVYSFYQFCC